MRHATAMPSQTVEFPCDPLGDHFASCTDPLCQVCHLPDAVPAVRHLKIPPGREGPGVFPFEPVFNLLSPGEHLRKCNGAHLDGVISGIARRLDVDRQYVYRWLRRGLTDHQADVIAVMVGLHPCLIWADWFEHAPSEEEIEAAAAAAILSPRKPYESRMAELYTAGMTHRQIADMLMAEGYRTYFRGRVWTVAMVCNQIGRMRRREVAA